MIEPVTVTAPGEAPADELAAGTEIGPYRVVGVLGRGGMGVVLEARHVRVGQRAALKILAAARRSEVGTGAVRRFLAEVEVLSRLEHPGLVRILDRGESPVHGPWLAMELVAGEPLRAHLERAGGEPLPLAFAVRTARRIASAVAALHATSIVHRDLKPDNVMIVPDDEVPGGQRVKLLDFGIAKLVGGEATHTTEGTVLGTAAYMAPEQCTGQGDVDDRADVYALGVILFELMVGGRPFVGSGPDIMRQHLFTEPPLDRLPAEVPVALRELVRELLAKEPSRRPAIEQVVARLRAVEVGLGTAPEAEPALPLADTLPARAVVTTAPGRAAGASGATAASGAGVTTLGGAASALHPPPPRRRRWPWLAGGVLVIGAVAALAGPRLLARPRPARPTALPGMVVIEGGRYRQGSTEAELSAECAEVAGGCLPEERPMLERELGGGEVVVSTFQLDAREVTNREYAAFLNVRRAELSLRDDKDDHYPRFVDELARPGATARTLIDLDRRVASLVGERYDEGREVRFTVVAGREELPVDTVTWDGAVLYCRDRGKRLPTEAEWELAARGPKDRRFPWGNAPPSCAGVVFGREDARGCPNVRAVLERVATASQDVTPAGVHDLAGSVLEWVADSFEVYRDCGGCRDPLVEVADSDYRVMRGGSYIAPTLMLRTTTRSRLRRGSNLYGLGFRCATR